MDLNKISDLLPFIAKCLIALLTQLASNYFSFFDFFMTIWAKYLQVVFVFF